jgi:hypothetical protein
MEEYLERVGWSDQVKSCIQWMSDNEKKMLNATRLRNWMKNAIKFSKEKEVRDYEKEQERRGRRGERRPYEPSQFTKKFLNEKLSKMR